MKDNDYMLLIEDLSVEVEGERLLQKVNLKVRKGEVHVIFGPNGSGKSSLLHAVMGLPKYEIVSGDIKFEGESIIDYSITERAKMGIGLAFQHPPVVEGVPLKSLLDVVQKNGESIEDISNELDLEEHLDRYINVGFSGGERKRGELVQLLIQSPRLILFDEPDSGVDVDNMKLVVEIIKRLLEKDVKISMRNRSGLIVTHSGTILESVHADKGYVMVDGRLVCSGVPLDIFDQIKEHGFSECIKGAKIYGQQ